MTKNVLIFVFCLVSVSALSGCSQFKQTTASGTSEDTSTQQPEEKVDCETGFVQQWCSVNQASSAITDVCHGTVTMKDLSTRQAVLLKIASGNECLYDNQKKDLSVTMIGCAAASVGTYVSDAGGTLDIVRCKDINHDVISYVGSSVDGLPFEAVK